MYVDQRNGTNEMLCGKNRKNPCKDLVEGVRRSKVGGTVYVVGSHHLQQSVILSKSITTVTDNIEQGRITSDGSIDFAFTIESSEDIDVTWESLHFDTIGLFKLKDNDIKQNIFIDNVVVRNVSTRKPTVVVEYSSISSLRTVRIHNSRFEDTTGLFFKNVLKVAIPNFLRVPQNWF